MGLVLAAEGPPADEAASGRLAVAVAAYHAGYYLMDVVEVAARSGVTARDLARLWAVAVRTDAEGVFVLGLDDDAGAVLGPMADELRLTVRVVPAVDEDDDLPPGHGAPPPTRTVGERSSAAGP